MTGTAKRLARQAERAPTDEVEEASEQSFPASDAPAWTGVHAGRPAPPGRRVPEQVSALRSQVENR